MLKKLLIGAAAVVALMVAMAVALGIRNATYGPGERAAFNARHYTGPSDRDIELQKVEAWEQATGRDLAEEDRQNRRFVQPIIDKELERRGSPPRR